MIVITTPTGTIGRQVLENVLDSDEPLRVIVRDPSQLSPAARERVEVVEGSHGDPSVVKLALVGADAVFWLCPPHPTAESVDDAFVGFSRPAAEAFRAHGVNRVRTTWIVSAEATMCVTGISPACSSDNGLTRGLLAATASRGLCDVPW